MLKFVRWGFPILEKIAPPLAEKAFITIFFKPLKYVVPEKEKQFAESAEKFTITVAGKIVQCYSWGKGPVVWVVHGWAGRATQFRKIIQAFVSAGYRVVGFDGPAHGNSQGKNTNIIEFEQAFRELHKKTGRPEGVIAHSFGGGAVLYAAMNGMDVPRLINIASPTIGDEIINTYLRAINGSKRTGESFKEWIIQKYGRPFDEFTSLWFIRRLPAPIDLLLVHDRNDRDVTVEHAQALKAVYPAAQLLVTEGLGHTRILKDEKVIDQCVTFVREGRLTS